MSLVIIVFAEPWGIGEITVSNQQLLRKTESRSITSIVHQRQLQLYGHVARYPEADPTCRVVSESNKQMWKRTKGAHKVRGWDKSIIYVGSYLVWEGDLHRDSYWVISAWGWRRRVGEATRPLAYAPND